MQDGHRYIRNRSEKAYIWWIIISLMLRPLSCRFSDLEIVQTQDVHRYHSNPSEVARYVPYGAVSLICLLRHKISVLAAPPPLYFN